MFAWHVSFTIVALGYYVRASHVTGAVACQVSPSALHLPFLFQP